jgi:hypothetical protein
MRERERAEWMVQPQRKEGVGEVEAEEGEDEAAERRRLDLEFMTGVEVVAVLSEGFAAAADDDDDDMGEDEGLEIEEEGTIVRDESFEQTEEGGGGG